MMSQKSNFFMDFVPIFYCDIRQLFFASGNSEKVVVDLIVHDMQDDFLFTTEYVKIRPQLQILC